MTKVDTKPAADALKTAIRLLGEQHQAEINNAYEESDRADSGDIDPDAHDRYLRSAHTMARAVDLMREALELIA